MEEFYPCYYMNSDTFAEKMFQKDASLTLSAVRKKLKVEPHLTKQPITHVTVKTEI